MTKTTIEIINNYGRTGEIFYPLLCVAPSEAVKKTLTSLAIGAFEEQSEDEATSIEAEVIRAILMHKAEAKDNRLGWAVILAEVNMGRDKEDRLKERQLGWVGRRLHLKKGRLSDGKRAIIIDQRLLKQHCITYDVSLSDPSQKTSKRQNVRKKPLFTLRESTPDVSPKTKAETLETSEQPVSLSKPDVSDVPTFPNGGTDATVTIGQERFDIPLIQDYIVRYILPSEVQRVGYAVTEKIDYALSLRYGDNVRSLTIPQLQELADRKIIEPHPSFRNAWRLPK